MPVSANSFASSAWARFVTVIAVFSLAHAANFVVT